MLEDSVGKKPAEESTPSRSLSTLFPCLRQVANLHRPVQRPPLAWGKKEFLPSSQAERSWHLVIRKLNLIWPFAAFHNFRHGAHVWASPWPQHGEFRTVSLPGLVNTKTFPTQGHLRLSQAQKEGKRFLQVFRLAYGPGSLSGLPSQGPGIKRKKRERLGVGENSPLLFPNSHRYICTSWENQHEWPKQATISLWNLPKCGFWSVQTQKKNEIKTRVKMEAGIDKKVKHCFTILESTGAEENNFKNYSS